MTKGAKFGVGCLILILLAIGAVAAMFFGVFAVLKGSEAYKHAVATAEQHPDVLAVTGSPLKPGVMPSGSVNLENNDGSADLSIHVSGPDGAGIVTIKGTKTAGVWDYSQLDFTSEDGATKVDLRSGSTLAP